MYEELHWGKYSSFWYLDPPRCVSLSQTGLSGSPCIKPHMRPCLISCELGIMLLVRTQAVSRALQWASRPTCAKAACMAHSYRMAA